METIHSVRLSEQPQQQQLANDAAAEKIQTISSTATTTSISVSLASSTSMVTSATSTTTPSFITSSSPDMTSIFRTSDYYKQSKSPSTTMPSIESNTTTSANCYAASSLTNRIRYVTTAVATSVSTISYQQQQQQQQRVPQRLSLLPTSSNYPVRPQQSNSYDSISIASLLTDLNESGSHTISTTTMVTTAATQSQSAFSYAQSRITTGAIQQSYHHHHQTSQPSPSKKIRLQQQCDVGNEMAPLKIEIKEKPGAYKPQVEAISPTLPGDNSFHEDSIFRATKDSILQQIGRVDRDITKVERQLDHARKKEIELSKRANSPIVDIDGKVNLTAKLNNGLIAGKEVQIIGKRKRQSLAQKIYAENREKARIAHEFMENLGKNSTLPLYNQPSDTKVYHENKKNFEGFRKRLLSYLTKVQQERHTRQQQMAQQYGKMMQDWLKKVEKVENSPKRKMKDAKNREFFEKMFPELRKQREDKERLNRVGSRIKSEADMEEIMDGLQEQEMEDKKMRSYAVIPPILIDQKDRKFVYQNFNGRIQDMEAEYKERQFVNIWTPIEKEYFREKYLQHPKNFSMIASYLERKSVSDCVQYYYKSKKAENYKRLLRKTRQRHRTTRNNAQKVNASSGNTIAPLTSGSASTMGIVTTLIDSTLLNISTGVTTRLQQQKIGPASAVGTSVTVTTSTVTLPITTSTITASTVSTATVSVTTSAIVSSVSTLTTTVTTTTTTTTTTTETSIMTAWVADSNEPHDKTVNESDDDDVDEISSFEDGDNKDDGDSVAVGFCVICKQEFGPQLLSRVVTANMARKLNCSQFKDEGNSSTEQTPNRICVTCLQDSLNVSVCPVPNCGRLKKLRSLPSKLLASDESTRCRLLNVEESSLVTKCCSDCFRALEAKMQSSRDVGNTDVDNGIENISDDDDHRTIPKADINLQFSQEDIQSARQLFRQFGPDWKVLSEKLKVKCTINQLKELYNSRKEYFHQDGAVDQDMNGREKDNIDRSPISDTNTDGAAILSDPVFRLGKKRRHSSETNSVPGSPRKEDYDSSATETADETTEQYQNAAISCLSSIPITSIGSASALATVTIAQTQSVSNPPVTVTTSHSLKQQSPISVQDIMLNVIEIQLMKNHHDHHGSSDIGSASSMRSAYPPSQMSAQYIQQQTPTISSILTNEDFNGGRSDSKSTTGFITPMIAATITPVPVPGPGQVQEQSLSLQQSPLHLANNNAQYQSHYQKHLQPQQSKSQQAQHPVDPEPLTLDLSVKKFRPDTSISIIKNQAPATSYYSHQPHQQPSNFSYNHIHDRKSPAIFVPSQSRLIQKSQQSLGNQPATISLKTGGSITHGTPVINQSPYMRNQNEPNSKLIMGGSITQGTPIPHRNPHLQHPVLHALQQNTNNQSSPPPPPPHPTSISGSSGSGHPYMYDNKRLYDYYNVAGSIPKQAVAQNQSQAQQQQHRLVPHAQHHSPPPQPILINTNSYRPTYSVEQQLSSRQIILNDYITSQQMLGGLRRPNLPITAPRPVAPTPPQAPAIIQHQSQPQTQPQQQRQGVIQRHSRTMASANTSLSRAPTSQHTLYTGHEAFSSLVDVAVQQPSLPVPQQNSSSHESIMKSVPEHLNESHRFQMRQQQQQQLHRLQMYTQHQNQSSNRPSSTTPASTTTTSKPLPTTSAGGNVSLTAATLIDAIITHQINLPPSSTSNEQLNRNSEYGSNRNDIQRPSDRLFQSFTLATQEAVPSRIRTPTTNTDDDQKRQVIRMTQKYEPVSPPESTASNNNGSGGGGGGSTPYWPATSSTSSSHMSAFDYVKNRIVEVMHTEDDMSTSVAAAATSSSTTATTLSSTESSSVDKNNDDSVETTGSMSSSAPTSISRSQ